MTQNQTPDRILAPRQREAEASRERKIRAASYEKGFFDALRLAANHARACAEAFERNHQKGFRPRDPDEWSDKHKAEHWRILEKSILAEIRIQTMPKKRKLLHAKANEDSGGESSDQSDV